MKEKSSIWIAKNVERKMLNFLGHKFWARGYLFTTVGWEETGKLTASRNEKVTLTLAIRKSCVKI